MAPPAASSCLKSRIRFTIPPSSPPIQAAQALLNAINDLAPIDKATSILDIAAGSGTVFSQIFESDITHNPSTAFIAQDRDDVSLDQIRLRKDDVNWQRVQTVLGDGANLQGIGDSSQSHVMSQMGIFLMSDTKSALSEARRVLKPGGVFGMTSVASASWTQEVLGQVGILFPARKLPAVDSRWTQSNDYKTTLETAGFRHVEVSETEIWIPFTDRQAIVDGLWSMPFVQEVMDGMIDDENEQAKQAMLEVIENRYPELPGKLPGTALIGVGVK